MDVADYKLENGESPETVTLHITSRLRRTSEVELGLALIYREQERSFIDSERSWQEGGNHCTEAETQTVSSKAPFSSGERPK